MRSKYIALARKRARELVYQFGATRPDHIAIRAYALALGITRIEVIALDGAGSQLVCTANHKVIQISSRIVDPEAFEFAIVHEIGHMVLGHPSAMDELGIRHHSRHDDDARRDYEAEADAFASELLMPFDMVMPLMRDHIPVDLRVAKEIRRTFKVSLLAAAIRVVELSSERCAVVFGDGGRVRWMVKNDTFPFTLARRTPLTRRMLAHSFFTQGTLTAEVQHVPASAWFPDGGDVELVEHVTSSIEYGTTLSMLWLPQRADVALVASR